MGWRAGAHVPGEADGPSARGWRGHLGSPSVLRRAPGLLRGEGVSLVVGGGRVRSSRAVAGLLGVLGARGACMRVAPADGQRQRSAWPRSCSRRTRRHTPGVARRTGTGTAPPLAHRHVGACRRHGAAWRRNGLQA